MSDNEEAKEPEAEASEDEGGEELETIEIVTGGIDDEGNVVIDDLVAEVDREGHIVATDETVIIERADGEVLVDETFSVAGADGELHVIEENVTVLEPEEEDEEATA